MPQATDGECYIRVVSPNPIRRDFKAGFKWGNRDTKYSKRGVIKDAYLQIPVECELTLALIFKAVLLKGGNAQENQA